MIIPSTKTLAFLLPLLSLATLTGAHASAAPDSTADVAAGAVGAAAKGDEQMSSQTITLGCPIASGYSRSVRLSSGEAPWTVAGPGASAPQSTELLEAGTLPPAWSELIGGAHWLGTIRPDNPAGEYIFVTRFRVLHSPSEMRVTLKGRVLADEKFSVELIEPEPETGPADHPGQWGANADVPNPAQLTAKDIYDVDLLVGEAVFQNKHSGSKTPRPGNYEVRVTVENSAAHAKAVAMVAQLELNQTCLNWGQAKPPKKRAKKRPRSH